MVQMAVVRFNVRLSVGGPFRDWEKQNFCLELRILEPNSLLFSLEIKRTFGYTVLGFNL